jgi:hypothetical protein
MPAISVYWFHKQNKSGVQQAIYRLFFSIERKFYMRLSLTLSAAAFGCLLFGIAFLLFPSSMLPLYGVAPQPAYDWIAQLFGSALFGFAAILWFARKVQAGPALYAILLGTFIASSIGLIVMLLKALNSQPTVFMWFSVVIYGLLTLGFGDFVFRVRHPK